MLEACFHQGAGLHRFMPQTPLRVLGVASPEYGAREALEALWHVCGALQKLAGPVLVLDGTAGESQDVPGLLHLLQQAPWQDRLAPSTHSSAALAVLPAARGLPRLLRLAQQAGAPPLQGLLPYFRAYGVVVLLAPAEWLAVLLAQTVTMPLVFMPPGEAAMLAAYHSAKQFAVHAGLTSRVVALLERGAAAQRAQAQTALDNLQRCAAQYLGGLVRTAIIEPHNPQDVQRLALQLLENAGTIEAVHGSASAPQTAPRYTGAFRSEALN
ncbi:hypothetical protein [Extensimonas vulgaris]|uniref:Uncharacterized protein n=1 Tax=Extensimonas vulgaris TaxID=1031594 RepID=A0A369AG18_9BURK|nr:hypothetical protein [Extensimonas vulgaris]RCX08093.1 hypothetical protein DFR45_1102 [Extensimonas vulgaris]TWI36276.1 hypothetical protein IP95_02319 [Extensimonas vulgaris]TXD13625.1 hypothetical protein FUT63_11550 [Extensimonas vulgaris]